MNRPALGRLTVGGVLFVVAVLLLGSSLSSELRPSASSGTSEVLSWEKKISIAESLGLPTRLPSPFHRIEWGNKRGGTGVAQKELIQRVESLLSNYQMANNVFLSRNGPLDFRINKDDAELLIAIGVLRVLHQDYACAHTDCYPVLVASFRKMLQGYAIYRRAASWFLSKENPLTTPYEVNALWTSMYPTTGCSYTPRDCDLPDGCRFFCNPKTLQLKGDKKGQQESAPRNSGGLNVVSLGSHDEFAYEESVVRRFGANSINNMAIFDCTVAADQLTQLPKVVGDLPGYRYVNKCLVSHGLRGPPKGELPFTAKDLVKETGNRRHIDLFKMDIEGSEFGVIHELLVEQLKFDLLGEGIPPTFSIFQFEMHLSYIPSKKLDNDKKRDTILQAGHVGHLCFLELHALGFTVARMERNPWFPSYTEVMLPHSTYFVESEVNEVFL